MGTQICDGDTQFGYSAKYIFDSGLSYHPEPGLDGKSLVVDGQRSTVPGLRDIRHIVLKDSLTIINETLPNHVLYPGYVTKQGVTGTYQYGGNAGPHAVTSANGLSYHYDNNGNLVEARNSSNQVVRRVDYSVMNMPTHIEKGGRSTDIIYGATHKRIKRVDSNGSSITRTTWYFGDRYEESTDAAGITRKTYYIGDFAQRIEEVQSGISYHEFLHKDHLGSIVKRSSDLSYSDLAATLFGAWRARLQGGWGSAPTGPDFNAHDVRGFTGHEHLDPVGLIHMNGRVYDPELGRFLSPDPVVQAPYNTQNYNRYSYVWNNPLSLVDPSGYYCRGPDGLSNLMIQTALSHIEGMHQQAAMDSVRFIAKVGALKAMQMSSKPGELQGGGGAAGGDALEEAQSPSASSQPVSSTTDDAKAQSASVKPVSYESVKAVQDVKQTIVDAKSVAPDRQSLIKAIENMTGDYDSPQAAAEALHSNEALMKLAKAWGVELWAVIDQKSFSIKEVGVGTASSAKDLYLGTYRGGDSVWHSHPSGKDIHSGDWDSAYLGGGRGSASYIFASGSRLTGYNVRAHTLPFSNDWEYRNYSGSWRFQKLIYENGSWSSLNGTFSK